MKAELKVVDSRMNNAQGWVRDLKDRIMEITQSEQQTESQMKKWTQYKRDLLDNIKPTNLHIIKISEG